MTKSIKPNKEIGFIRTESIDYIEAYSNYSKIYYNGHSMALSNSLLVEFENKMDARFFKIHNSFIINLKRVMRYDRSGEVELENGVVLSVSRRRKTDFLNKLKQIMTGMKSLKPVT